LPGAHIRTLARTTDIPPDRCAERDGGTGSPRLAGRRTGTGRTGAGNAVYNLLG